MKRLKINISDWMAGFALLFLSTGALAQEPQPQASEAPSAAKVVTPSWASGGTIFLTLSPNQSILSDFRPQKEDNFFANFTRMGNGAQAQQRLEDINRDYDMRAQYGLMDAATEQNHLNQIQDFGRGIYQQAYAGQMQDLRQKAMVVMDQHPEVKAAATPVGVVAGVYAIYSGEPLAISNTDTFRLVTRTDVRAQHGQLVMNTPILNTNFDYYGGVVANADPNGPPPADPASHDERYRLSLNRTIPEIGMGSGLTYGSTSSTLIASVSKQMANHLTCVLDSIYALAPDNSDVKVNEQRIQLLYGLNF